ncbi:short-chain dehydrogenase [Rhodococcus sp. ACPA4]|uniref:SDR family oxidoreductase n=1 Tax=Rhodococcus globerulus TaxID=33008 RepID=A0ABU4C220_RHOGO|nr:MULTISPECIES: SDR family oxidoreductase [Rhodococcus]MCE4265775.1 SDR family oxidoreductase [Rhodococcus globerulus]MDV6270527.1 SDR family oxidoreductase [Rhodococcus globerulus]PBC42931.1 short-chain dehydrogenase [Rhodococcus sp. ACPA4]QXW05228.1 SDR family oxidoreductase [Rhodococcus globerulus]
MGNRNLTDRRVIITGGASGMGAALVKAFGESGAKVVSFDVTADEGARIAAEAGAEFIRCDVTDKESVDQAFARGVKSLKGLDVLIHAAGIAPGAPAESTPLSMWESTMAVNATGTFLTNQAAFEYLKDGGGRIINFASAAGAKGLMGKAAYAASKGAVLGWSRTVAAEWAQYGITVNSIAPAIRTPMYETTRASMTPEQLVEHDRKMTNLIPLGGKLGNVEDLVPVLEFVAGEGSRFMTGQIFAVDGGSLMVR